MESHRNNLKMDLLSDNYIFSHTDVLTKKKKQRTGTGREMRATKYTAVSGSLLC